MLFVLFAGWSIGSPAFAATANPPPTLQALTAPTGVKAVLESNGTVVITWKPPAGNPRLGGYIVERNHSQLTKLTADGHGGPTTYTDPRPLTGTDIYDIEAYSPAGTAGPASDGASLSVTGQALGGTNATPNQGPSGADTVGPNLQGNNSPTAFEVYGKSAGQVNETYGFAENPFNRGFMSMLNIVWYFITMHAYLALSFLAWGLTRKFYAPLVTVVTQFITAYFKMPLFGSLTILAMILGVGALSLRLLKGHVTWVVRGLGIIVLVVGGMTLYANFAPRVVQTTMNYPVEFGDYVLGAVNGALPANPGHDQFNLQVRPTFNGNPFDQQVRRYQDAEWTTTVYPTVCQLNFGDEQWAITHFVPDDSGAPSGFHHLTYCEFYLATVSHNGAERDYLGSQVQQNSPPEVWDMYQGNNLPRHYWIATLGGLVITIRSLYIDLLAFSFVLGEVLIAIWLVKMALIGLGAAIEQVRPLTNDMVKRMVITGHIPIGGAIIAVIGLALSNELAARAPQYGWTASMAYQLAVAIGMLVALIMMWVRRRHARAERIRIDGSRGGGGGGGGTGATVSGAATVAAGAATGGAAAAATWTAITVKASSAGGGQPRARQSLPPPRSGPRSVAGGSAGPPPALPGPDSGGRRRPQSVQGRVVESRIEPPGMPMLPPKPASSGRPPRALPPGGSGSSS
jgi:hypothetical protein